MKKLSCIKYLAFISGCLTIIGSLPKANAQFANGADVSWVTQMEASNIKFYNSAGTQQDLFDVIKSKCINSIRLRVWVNPAGGWCNKADVVAKAIRAQNKGYRILIDFHYSDTWADPGHQAYPAAWVSDTAIGQLATDVYNHTTDVLDSLKANGITPEWVQVGNETNNGMLWDQGEASLHMNNFAQLITSGYNAVKAVSPTTKVIVHISNGYDNSLFQWMFDGLKSNGAQWDIIGMSLYPPTAGWATYNTECLANMNDMVSRYGKQVMIVEVGMPVTAVATCDSFLTDIIAKTQSVTGGNGLGVFYWEPECYNNWQGYGMGAFDNTGKPTAALNAFGRGCNQPSDVSITAPANNAKFTAPASVTITAIATDPDGIISNVAFYNGTTLLGTVTTSPYSFSWTNVPAGTYTIYIKATDNGGAVTTSAYTTITVTGTTGTAPPASITAATTTTFCKGGSVVLNANIGAGYTYQWNSGGAAISGATAASYTATTAGSYTVTVTSGGLSTTSTATVVTVNIIPAAPTVTSPVTYCEGATATALTATGTALKWYAAATGGTGNTTAPMPATITVGTTDYYVSQTTNTCESPRATIAVTVNAIPAAPTVTTPVTYCQNATASALTATGTALKWYAAATGGTGNTTAPTPATITVGTTDYYVSQTTNTCESPRATIAVTIDSPPSTANAGTNQYTTSTAANLSANAPTVGTGTWSVISGTGNFTDVSMATTDVSGLTFGANVFEWIISNASCPSSSSTVTINVGSSPVTQTITGPNEATVNESGIAYSVPDYAGSTYHWSLPAGAIIASANTDSSSITVNFSSQGGIISVTETNPYGIATSNLTVSVGNAPVAQTINGKTYIATNSVGVTYSVLDNAGSTYHWTLPAGATITSANTDSSQITVNFGSTVETGTVSVTETNPYGSATSSLPISVGNPPSMQTITGKTTILSGETGVTYSVPDNAGSTYHWLLPAGATISTANADSSSVTIDFGITGGALLVQEINPFGNATDTLTISIGSATGLISKSATISYEIRPNPFSDYTSIIIHSPISEQLTISILDVQGVICYTSSQCYTNQELKLGNELRTDGVYFAEITYGNEACVLKLVKIK